MKNWNKTIFLSGLISLAGFVAFAQEILTKEQAVAMVLEKNFGVQISNNQVEMAKNSSSIYNTGYLPEFGIAGGANYTLNNLSAEFQDGRTTSLNGATATAYNASLGMNYAIFDGLGRMYNYRQLKEQYNLSELEARETIEEAISQLFSVYYEVAFLTQNVNTLNEILEVSKERVRTLQYQFEYGQTNRLNVLNAEVDLTNDSINFINAQLNLRNMKRTLNFILARDVDTPFEVDTSVLFTEMLQKEKLMASAERNNVRLMQARKNYEIGDYNRMINRAAYLPKLNLNTAYGYNKNFNNEASFLASSMSYGLNGGLSLSWNIFDGGRTKIAQQNIKINQENLVLMMNQTNMEVQRDFLNAWDEYQNKLYIYFTQERNMQTNQLNFDRTHEQFKLGQINSVEFRQAQINLQNAINGRDKAKFEAKFAELQVLQLSGLLLEAVY
jgi:outer membrane protein TolC